VNPGGAVWQASAKSKRFFFEKKQQKTSICWGLGHAGPRSPS
jgi:hypothetical protein